MRLFAAGEVIAEVNGGGRIDGLEAPLVGRDAELRALKAAFHSTEEARRPHLVVLDGEAGIGKSRLGWEFEKYIDGLATTVQWHRGRCLSYGDGVAFWALAEALRPRLGLLEMDQGATVEDRLDRGLEVLVDDPDERAWLRPRLAALLGIGNGTFAREDLDDVPRASGRRGSRRPCDRRRALCGRRPPGLRRAPAGDGPYGDPRPRHRPS
jgi:predicted ATPase